MYHIVMNKKSMDKLAERENIKKQIKELEQKKTNSTI